jgi:hypothetical protein
MVGSFFAAVVCFGLLWFLVVMIRFSFVGGARAKGSEKRLQRPALSEVEAKWGVKLPQSLETYFRSEIVTRSDFYLAPPGSDQSKWWYIESFLPLTRRDVSEWIKITNVPGIPIALDASKGTYYLPFQSLRQKLQAPVLLRLPGRARKDVEVASSVEELLHFEPRNAPPEEA